MRVSSIKKEIQRKYDFRNCRIGTERFPWDRGYHEGYLDALKSVLDLISKEEAKDNSEHWQPRYGEVYFFLETLNVGVKDRPTVFAGIWRNTEADRQRNERNNCFRSQSSAAAYRREFCVGEK